MYRPDNATGGCKNYTKRGQGATTTVAILGDKGLGWSNEFEAEGVGVNDTGGPHGGRPPAPAVAGGAPAPQPGTKGPRKMRESKATSGTSNAETSPPMRVCMNQRVSPASAMISTGSP